MRFKKKNKCKHFKNLTLLKTNLFPSVKRNNGIAVYYII